MVGLKQRVRSRFYVEVGVFVVTVPVESGPVTVTH